MEGIGELIRLTFRVVWSVLRGTLTHPLGTACIVAFGIAPWLERNWLGMVAEAQHPTPPTQRFLETAENMLFAALWVAYHVIWPGFHWPILAGYIILRRVFSAMRGGIDWRDMVVDSLEDVSVIATFLLGVTLILGKAFDLPGSIIALQGKYGPLGPDAVEKFFIQVPNSAVGSWMIFAALIWPFITIWRLRTMGMLRIRTGELCFLETGDNIISTALLVFAYLPLAGLAKLLALLAYLLWKVAYTRAQLNLIAALGLVALTPEGAAVAAERGVSLPVVRATSQRILLSILADMLVIAPLAVGAYLALAPGEGAGFAISIQEWWALVSTP